MEATSCIYRNAREVFNSVILSKAELILLDTHWHSDKESLRFSQHFIPSQQD